MANVSSTDVGQPVTFIWNGTGNPAGVVDETDVTSSTAHMEVKYVPTPGEADDA